MSNRRPGRNARKKLANKLQAQQLQHYSAVGSGRDKVELETRLLTKGQLLAQVADAWLESCRKELDKRAVLLGPKGCWSFYQQSYQEALKYGVENELRSMASSAAARFMGRSVQTVRQTS